MVGALDTVIEVGIVLIVLMMLACPLVMGAMMFLMWRGMRQHRGVDRATERPDTLDHI